MKWFLSEGSLLDLCLGCCNIFVAYSEMLTIPSLISLLFFDLEINTLKFDIVRVLFSGNFFVIVQCYFGGLMI